MGVKTCGFCNAEGDNIIVEFSGENVTDGVLNMAAQPVILQTDGGGGEYQPIRYTTATISILTDGMQYLDLYATEPMSIKVVVRHSAATKGTLFSGYVTPNTFNQPLDGMNDVLSIEAVDYLGAAKYIPYQLINPTEGFSTLTLRELLMHVAALIGAPDVLLMQFVSLVGTTNSTSAYWTLAVPEDYFFESSTLPRVLPDGTLSYDATAITCYDVLEMIAASFRATWVTHWQYYSASTASIDAIALIDPVALASQSNGVKLRRLHDAGDSEVTLGALHRLTEDSFAATGSNISLLPRYSLFSIKHEDAGTREVLPSILDDTLLYAMGDLATESIEEDTASVRYQLSQALGSHACEVTPLAQAAAGFVAHKEIEVFRRSYPDTLKLSDNWDSRLGGWNKYIRIAIRTDEALSSPIKVLSIRPAFRCSVAPSKYTALRLSLSAAFSRELSTLYPGTTIDKSRAFVLHVAIKCGGYYFAHNSEFYDEMYNWTTSPRTIPLFFSQESEWRNEYTTYLFPAQWNSNFAESPIDGNEKILADTLPHGGPIEIELWVNATSYSGVSQWRTCWIKDLRLEVVPSTRAQAFTRGIPAQEYRGTYAFDREAEAAEFPITFGYPQSATAYGTIVSGAEITAISGTAPNQRISCALLFADSPSTPVSNRYSLLERVERLGNFGDGREISVQLRDANNCAFNHFTTVTSSEWEGNKIVAAITKDLKESTVEVKLN